MNFGSTITKPDQLWNSCMHLLERFFVANKIFGKPWSRLNIGLRIWPKCYRWNV